MVAHQVGQLVALSPVVSLLVLGCTVAFGMLLALKVRSAPAPCMNDTRTFSRKDLLRVNLEEMDEESHVAGCEVGEGI